jgi:hypothetical protein
MSVARQQASRDNGAKSVGPVTNEGKARSSRNATRHGLTGGTVVLPNESQDLFDELRQSYYNHYRPTTDMECSLIEEIAETRWRMRRLSVLEAAILDQACETQMDQMGSGADQRKAMAKAFVDVAENSKAWRMLERYQRTLRRTYEKARTELEQLGSELAYEMVAAEQQAAEQQAAEQLAAVERKQAIQQEIEEWRAANKQNEPGDTNTDEASPSPFLASVLPYLANQQNVAKQQTAKEDTSNNKNKKQNEPAKRAFAA